MVCLKAVKKNDSSGGGAWTGIFIIRAAAAPSVFIVAVHDSVTEIKNPSALMQLRSVMLVF